MSTPIPENETARVIVDATFHVHKHLGPGLLESVYQLVLTHELRKRGRAGLTKQDVANTRSWPELRKLVKRGR